MVPNETSKLLSPKTSTVKGKGKARADAETDLEAQLDGANQSHRNHSHDNTSRENLAANEADDLQGSPPEQTCELIYSRYRSRYTPMIALNYSKP